MNNENNDLFDIPTELETNPLEENLDLNEVESLIDESVNNAQSISENSAPTPQPEEVLPSPNIENAEVIKESPVLPQVNNVNESPVSVDNNDTSIKIGNLLNNNPSNNSKEANQTPLENSEPKKTLYEGPDSLDIDVKNYDEEKKKKGFNPLVIIIPLVLLFIAGSVYLLFFTDIINKPNKTLNSSLKLLDQTRVDSLDNAYDMNFITKDDAVQTGQIGSYTPYFGGILFKTTDGSSEINLSIEGKTIQLVSYLASTKDSDIIYIRDTDNVNYFAKIKEFKEDTPLTSENSDLTILNDDPTITMFGTISSKNSKDVFYAVKKGEDIYLVNKDKDGSVTTDKKIHSGVVIPISTLNDSLQIKGLFISLEGNVMIYNDLDEEYELKKVDGESFNADRIIVASDKDFTDLYIVSNNLLYKVNIKSFDFETKEYEIEEYKSEIKDIEILLGKTNSLDIVFKDNSTIKLK